MARLWKGKSRTAVTGRSGSCPGVHRTRQAGQPTASHPQDCSDRPCRTAVAGRAETRATATYSAWLIKYLRMGKGSSTACAELSTYPGSFGTAGRGDLSIPVVWCMGEQTHHGPHVSPRTEGMSPETQPSKTPQRSKAFPPGSPFNLPS